MLGFWLSRNGMALAAVSSFAALLPFLLRRYYRPILASDGNLPPKEEVPSRWNHFLCRIVDYVRTNPFRSGMALLLLIQVIYSWLVLTHPLSCRLNPAMGDMAAYAVGLLQRDDPSIFAGDVIFGDRRWASSIPSLYMGGLSALYHLSGQNLSRTMELYNLLALVLYTLGMYVLLRSLLPNTFVCLALALVTSRPSFFIVTGTYWGVNTPSWTALLNACLGGQIEPTLFAFAVPLVLYTAVFPWLAYLLVRWWFRHGWTGERIVVHQVALLGLIVGLSLSVHSISAVTVAELVTLVAVVQCLRRRLPWWSLGVFLLPLIPMLAWRTFFGVGVVEKISFAGAQSALAVGQDSYMVYPWKSLHEAPWWPDTAHPQLVIYAFLGGHALLSLLIGWLAWRSRPEARFWRLAFVTLQGVYAWIIIQTGWLMLLILLYGWNRVWQRKTDELDHWLLITLLIALLLGPAQQMAIYAAWKKAHLTSLTGLVYELARFVHFAYLPYFVLIGRATLFIASRIQIPALRALALILLVWLVSINLGQRMTLFTVELFLLGLILYLPVGIRICSLLRGDAWLFDAPVPGGEARDFLLAGTIATLAAMLFLLWKGLSSPSASLLVGLAVATAILLVRRCRGWQARLDALPLIVVPVLLLLTLVPGREAVNRKGARCELAAALRMSRAERQQFTTVFYAPPFVLTPEYLELTAWAKAHTAPDSLFHLHDADSSFRFFARRSIVICPSECAMGVYIGKDPARLSKCWQVLDIKRNDPSSLIAEYRDAKVDYVVARPMNANLPAEIVFQNDRYVVYHISPGPRERDEFSLRGGRE